MNTIVNTPAANAALFTDLAFVMFPVKDVKTSRQFYEEVLGLKVTANWDDQWVEYDIGHTTLGITTADADHQPGVRGATVGLEVGDFDRVLAHLQAKGVAISKGPFDSPSCRGCIIRDPDGNEILIHHRK
jgi:predicted enzyme related to lactoylglutathione lyase